MKTLKRYEKMSETEKSKIDKDDFKDFLIQFFKTFDKYLIQSFFRDDIEEIEFKDYPQSFITFTGQELNDLIRELIQKHDGINTIINNDIRTDEYTYVVNDTKIKKLMISYAKKGDKYVILSIRGFTVRKTSDDRERRL
jgi:hypothetical protein